MREKRSQAIPALAAFLLLCIFAVCVLGVLLAGAGAYSRLTRRDSRAYDTRTALHYLSARVRQAPAPDRVSVTDFGGADALTVTEEIGGEDYVTRIYCHAGWLMELFCAADGQFEPQDGERLLAVDGLELELRDELLFVTLTQEDGRHESVLYLERRKGALP